MSLTVRATGPLKGRIRVPGDKSISHRAVLFAAMADGASQIRGLLAAEDVLRTLRAVRALGVDATVSRIVGGPWKDVGTVDCGNSGTTARLLLGALAGRAGATLDGDDSLRRRPMARVVAPLRAMGANIQSDRMPIEVHCTQLCGVDHVARVASAQVKTAILLAGLSASGTTRYQETIPTRDHTERMLEAMGAPIAWEGDFITVSAGPIHGARIDIPGDISSAAFWMVAATAPGSDLVIEDVGLNPTRTGVLDALSRMGARVDVEVREGGIEPIGNIRVRGGELHGTEIGGREVPLLIDELPVLAVAAAFARGETVIRDAGELRVKESDRIAAIVDGLRAMRVDAEALPDGMRIRGGGARAAAVASQGDHRIAMAFAIAGLRTGMKVSDTACIGTSYPEFESVLRRVEAGGLGG